MATLRMKRVASTIAAVVLAASMLVAGLGLTGCSRNSSATVCAAIEKGIQSDVETLRSLTTGTATLLFEGEFTDSLIAAGINPVSLYGPLFENLKVEVTSVKMLGDMATAHLMVTNRDISAALALYDSRLSTLLSDPTARASVVSLSKEEQLAYLTDMFLKCLADETVRDVTTRVDLDYVQEGDRWVTTGRYRLVEAMLGGIKVTDAIPVESAGALASSEAAA